MKSSCLRKLVWTALTMAPLSAIAAVFPVPAAPQSVIGEIQHVQSSYEETLLDIGRRYGVGYEEMVAANPGVDPWIPGAGTNILIPSQFILPDAPHEGIIVNLPEHRLYYYPKPQPGEPAMVVTYPVSVGKMDWKTPLGLTHVADKRVKPFWYPPESVRKEHAADGRPLPKAIPPGPDNPLGEFAMRLAVPGGAYLIHGTNLPAGVGMQVTHGCIRMFPEDIEKFFPTIAVGTPVRILHQPYKMGWLKEALYMEAHTPLAGEDVENQGLTNITRLLVAATRDRTVPIDWAGAERVFHQATGVPEPMFLAATDARTSQPE